MLSNIEVKEVVQKKKFDDVEEHEHYRYEPRSEFDTPIVIHGTKKQLIPNPEIIRIKKHDPQVLQVFLKNIELTEKQFKDVLLDSVDKMELISILDKGFALKVEKDGQPLFLFIESGETMAFKNLCKILKIPNAYAKKNPEDLNQTNFDFWKKKIGLDKTPIRIVYIEKNPIGFQYEGNLVGGFPVQTIFPAAFNKNNGVKEALQIPLENEQGQISQIIPKVCSVLKLQVPTLEFHLDQILSGFNTGEHFVRILLNDATLNLIVDGVEYVPFVSISSNFDGWKKSFNRITLRFGWQDIQTSSNFMLPLRDEYAQHIRDTWVQEKIKQLKIAVADKRFNKVLKTLEKKAGKMFGGYQLTYSAGEVMASLNNSELGPMFQEFIAQRNSFLTFMQELGQDFNNVASDEFVETFDSLSRKYGLPESLTKYLVLEYLADEVDSFSSPLDLTNFIGFASQALKIGQQKKVEDLNLSLGKALAQSFVQRQSHRKAIVEKYKKYIKL